MKIKNKTSFFNAILCFVLALICIAAMIIRGYDIRFVISAILIGALGIINLWFAFSIKGIQEEIAGKADERDLYNAMKSGQTTIRITNRICSLAAISFLLIYAITKIQWFLIAGITLCAVICLIFITTLAANHYYEKKN